MNNLIPQQENLIKTIQQNGLSDLLKPLIKEIHLLDTYVADIMFERNLPIEDLKEGDQLILRREDTPYSEHTVAVLKSDGFRLGELPDFINEIFAHLLDAGKALKAKIRRIDIQQEYQMLLISICLLDF